MNTPDFELVTTEQATTGGNLPELYRQPSALELAGQAANHAAAAALFADYRDRKAENTLRRQDNDLALFREFLAAAGVETGDLATDPESWRGVTWGLVAAFIKWQLSQGYAVGSINVKLSTVKTYAKLALKAGAIQPGEYALIRAVEGYAHKEIKRVDERRELADIETRKGAKKADFVALTADQVKALKVAASERRDKNGKKIDPTPQNARDELLFCLMLDLGLRVGEVAALTVDGFKITLDKTGKPVHGELTFYRQKVDKVQTHELKSDVLHAAHKYLSAYAPAIGSVWRGSRKNGGLAGQGMSERAITARVRELGKELGFENLSAHDLRHTWATLAARNNTPVDRLQDAGGWNSPAMPLRYIEAAKIANTGVNLGYIA